MILLIIAVLRSVIQVISFQEEFGVLPEETDYG